MLVLVVACGGADGSGWRDVGAAAVEGVNVGADGIAVNAAAAAVGGGVGVDGVGVDDAGGIDIAAAVVVVAVVGEDGVVGVEGAISVGGEWSKVAGGATRRVGGDEIASAVSRGKAAITVRVVVLSEVFVIVVACLKGENEGVCAVRVSGEGVEGVR